MQDKAEKLIKFVYNRWKAGQMKAEDAHPGEESLVCFLEGRLSEEENERIKAHLISCEQCLEATILNLRMAQLPLKEAPPELLIRIKELAAPLESPALEIILRLKEKIIEMLNTTGDVLVQQEVVSIPVLRSRKIKDFRDEVTILKDFQKIRIEAKITNKGGKSFNLMIMVKDRQTQEIFKDLRVTLIKDDLELESRLTGSGSVVFEHVLLGKYRIEVSNTEDRLALIALDMRI